MLLASDNNIVDGSGQSNIQNIVTNYVLGIATSTTGTMFSVKDSIMNSIRGFSVLTCGVSSLTTKTQYGTQFSASVIRYRACRTILQLARIQRVQVLVAISG